MSIIYIHICILFCTPKADHILLRLLAADKPRRWQSLAPGNARVVYGATGASPRKAPAEHQIAWLASELNK